MAKLTKKQIKLLIEVESSSDGEKKYKFEDSDGKVVESTLSDAEDNGYTPVYKESKPKVKKVVVETPKKIVFGRNAGTAHNAGRVG